LSQYLKIENLVYGGSGLARTDDGKVVFIPFVLPGETVEVKEIVNRGNRISAITTKIVEPGKLRIEAPCKYFGICGGCHYQHIAYRHQLEIKKAILQEQIQRLGGLFKPEIGDIIGSNNEYTYRNHVQFHLDPEGRIGFQKESSHDVVAIEKCLLLEDSLNELLKSLTFDPDAGLTRVSIRDDGMGDPLLLISGNSSNPPEFEVDFPLNVVYRSQAGDLVLSGDSFNTFEIAGKSFQVSAGSFFQTNNQVAGKMIEHLIQKIDMKNNPFVLDLFCGVGFFSAFFAEKAGRLVGIESSEDTCSDFAINLDAFENIELYQGTVEQVLPFMDIKPDIAIIDPPRAGIAPAAMKGLLQCQPGQIAYISCDPSTLARDLKQLVAADYRIDSITPFDMFPQTYHIETIAILKKE
jgi:23S rRNA (uracil1939-C5)-methyltransferase